MPEKILSSKLKTVLVHHHLKRNTKLHQWTYWLLLIIAVVCIFSVFLIHVDLTVSSSGVIRPEVEKFEIRSGVEGVIGFSKLVRDRSVVKGDTLITINSQFIRDDINRLERRYDKIRAWKNDLELLIMNNSEVEMTDLRTHRLSTDYKFYSYELNALTSQFEILLKEINRIRSYLNTP